MKNKDKITFNKKNIHIYNYIKIFFYRSVFVIFFLLLLLLIKKINLTSTNIFVEELKSNINYNFHIVEDGKRVYNKAKVIIDNSLDTIGVFNITTKKYSTPIKGTIYKSFDQDVLIDNIRVKNKAIDIKSTLGEDPKAILNGTVKYIKHNDKRGYFVCIEDETIEVVYGYLSKVYVLEESKVEIGDSIGLIGTNKDGNKYLRIEVYIDGVAVDPLDYIDL